MGILRNAFILGAVVLALPNPPASEQPADVVPVSTSTFAYVAAAAETFADVRTFCERRPGVCQTAGQLAGSMEAKAKYGAKLIYEWANDASAPDTPRTALPPDIATADPIATGATGKKTAFESQSTLTLEDLLPEWKNPPARKKG
jgi:hypothetical protein